MLKKLNAWLHLWLGLFSGIVVFILSVTGCVLVFKQEIKLISSPWLHAEPAEGRAMLPPSVLYRSVAAAFPERTISSVWYHGSERTAHFSMDSDSLVYVDPYSAKVTAVVDHEDFFHFIDEGHRHLWLPLKIGRPIVGWATLIFFVLLITGIVLWWPKKWNERGRAQSFTIKWKATFKRLNYDLHNVLGFYSLLIALIFAFTGLMMSFPWVSKTLYTLAGEQRAPWKESLSDSTLAGTTVMLEQVDKAWHKATHEIGEYNPDQVIVYFPHEPAEAIYVCTDMYAGTWRDVYLDQYTLEELPGSKPKFKDERFAASMSRLNYGLHVGEVGGLTTKIMYFAASLICASLPVTGFYIWWGKKRKTRRVVKKSRKISEEAAALM